jgi:RNA 3'-terminal phosphate cyclase (ATP)
LIEIDGSKKSGSGTILRLAIALSAITRQPLHIHHIRQNRPKPGLRPQHLEAVLTAAKLCNATLEGANVNSHELWFRPKKAGGGRIEAEIGTAGSIPMLLIAVLPICAFAERTVELHVSKGGTDVSNSPTINYIRYVLLPTLKNMGMLASLTIHRYGYYPRGNGEITLTVEPCKQHLKSLRLEHFGRMERIKGISVCTFLAERKVADRQAKAANDYLAERGYSAEIQVIYDSSNPLQKGSSIVLWTQTDTNTILGADAIGELRKTSEDVGKEAAEKFHAEISTRPTVDTHLADLLIPYMALAEGRSAYLARKLSRHLETNIWLSEKILDVKFVIEQKGLLFKIERTD